MDPRREPGQSSPAGCLAGLFDPTQRIDNHQPRLLGERAQRALADAPPEVLAVADVEVAPAALEGLKFPEVLPRELALKTLAERSDDPEGAHASLLPGCRFVKRCARRRDSRWLARISWFADRQRMRGMSTSHARRRTFVPDKGHPPPPTRVCRRALLEC
ncbi:hypothetical protein GCM10027026_00940 [Myroides odoratimimus subsp. xuanwuensis]